MRPVSPIPPPSSRSTLSSIQTSSEYRVKFSMPRKLTDQVTSLRRNHRDRGKQQAERRRPSSEKGTVPTRLSRYLHEGQGQPAALQLSVGFAIQEIARVHIIIFCIPSGQRIYPSIIPYFQFSATSCNRHLIPYVNHLQFFFHKLRRCKGITTLARRTQERRRRSKKILYV